MGHKVHPIGFRIGVIRDWQAKWYADKHYAEFLKEDMKLRQGIQDRYRDAAVSQVEIERQANKVSVTIHTSRPGIVIGRGGQRVDETRNYLEKLVGKKVQLNIQEIQRAELDAYLVAKTIADQMERRVAYRRAMKQTMMRTMQAGAKGMRVSCAGRLGGAEIARRLTMHEGQVPLHTLRADIDYGFVEAHTVMGRIGVKVWVYKGQILPELKVQEAEVAEAAIEAPVAEEAMETVGEAVVAAPVTEPEVAPAAPRRRTRAATPKAEEAETAPAGETAEEPAKPAARRRTRATAPVVAEEPEAAPAAPRRRTRAATPKAEEAETAPAGETAEEPVKPASRRRTRAAAPTAETEAAPAGEAEEKPAATTRRRTRAAAPPEKAEGEDA